MNEKINNTFIPINLVQDLLDMGIERNEFCPTLISWEQAFEFFEDSYYITQSIIFDFYTYDIEIYDIRSENNHGVTKITSLLSVKGAPCFYERGEARLHCLITILDIIKNNKYINLKLNENERK